jgi:hypothetical protein
LDKYGVENFKMVILVVGIPAEWRKWGEELIISILESHGPLGSSIEDRALSRGDAWGQRPRTAASGARTR